jgi:pimeloyl-ACP methyl ester carboxylesterase
LPERLGQDFSVLAPTLPGHYGGPRTHARLDVESVTTHLEEVLDEEGLDRAHIVGFSLGGWLGLELAKRGRAKSLSAIAPAGAPANFDPNEIRRISRLFRRSRRGTQIAGPWLERLVRSPGFRRRALAEMMVNGHRLSPAEALALIQAAAATPAFNQLSEDLPRLGPIRGLERVEAPVQLLWGERDQVLPIANLDSFRHQLPEAMVQVLPRAGHVPFWDQPELIEGAIRDHAQAAEAARGLPAAVAAD